MAIKAVEALKTRNPERAVELFYDEIAESSIDFTIRFWTDPDQITYLTARSQAIKAIRQTFKEQGITIPYPTRTLDLSVAGERLREQLQRTGWPDAPREGKSKKRAGKEQKEKRAEEKKSTEKESG